MVLGVPMQIGGAALLQVVLAPLFALSVVLWAAAAARFAPSAAVLSGPPWCSGPATG